MSDDKWLKPSELPKDFRGPAFISRWYFYREKMCDPFIAQVWPTRLSGFDYYSQGMENCEALSDEYFLVLPIDVPAKPVFPPKKVI